MSYIRNLKNLNLRKFISSSEDSDFTTIKEAFDWFKTQTEGNIEFIIDAGIHIISESINIYNENNYNCNIKGLGSDMTYIQGDINLDSYSMFEINETYSTQISFSRINISHYNKNTGNNIFKIKNNGYHEFYDLILSNNDKVFYDESLSGGSMFCFNFIVDNVNIFYEGNCIGGGSIDFEVGTIENTPLGINLLASTDSKDIIINGVYYNGIDTGSTFIKIQPEFTLNSLCNIQNCGGNNIGNFQEGFDFSLSAGTYADVEIIGNSTCENKKPHFKINVVDNTGTTTVTTAGTYYKAIFENGITYTCKMLLEDNKITYLPSHKKDLAVWVAGNLSANQNNRNITIGWNKNEEGIIYSPFTIRTSVASQPYPFSFITYFSNISKNDFGELYLTSSSNGDIITIQDLNIFCLGM